MRRIVRSACLAAFLLLGAAALAGAVALSRVQPLGIADPPERAPLEA